MLSGQPSRTAFAAARHRAVHQVLEGGRIFDDPVAWRILAEDDPEQVLTAARDDPNSRRLRLFIAARHSFAEECLASAIGRGVGQLVVLGAGLDTFGYRNPHPGLTIYEVDHPDTSNWKRERLQEAGIDPPANVVFVTVDFERENFLDALACRGFDRAHPTFFMWLGVVPYLTRPALESTLSQIGSVAGAEVVFDYAAKQPGLSDADLEARRALRSRTNELGEPLQDPLEPDAVGQLLRSNGFRHIDDLAGSEIRARVLGLPGGGAGGGGHIVHAAVELSA